MITAVPGEIGNKEVLGPSGSTSRESTWRNELPGTTLSQSPCVKVRQPGSTVQPLRRHATNLLKLDDIYEITRFITVVVQAFFCIILYLHHA